MTLQELQKSCIQEASYLKVTYTAGDGTIITKNYEQLSKSELANMYCDADETSWFTKDPVEKGRAEKIKSACWAALMLRYWYRIYEWRSNSKSLQLEDVDFYGWLYESLRDAFYYRSWRPHRFPTIKVKDENGDVHEQRTYAEVNEQYETYLKKWHEQHPDSIGGDPDAADRSINYFVGAKRGKEYQAANKDKRKSNYGNKTYSIDGTYDEDGHSMLDRDINFAIGAKEYSPVAELVKLFYEENNMLGALIIDSICNGNSMKEYKRLNEWDEKITNANGEKEVVHMKANNYVYTFDPRKLVAFLNDLEDNDIKVWFSKTYGIANVQPLLDSFNAIKGNNNKLYKAITTTLETIRQTPRLMDCMLGAHTR